MRKSERKICARLKAAERLHSALARAIYMAIHGPKAGGEPRAAAVSRYKPAPSPVCEIARAMFRNNVYFEGIRNHAKYRSISGSVPVLWPLE